MEEGLGRLTGPYSGASLTKSKSGNEVSVVEPADGSLPIVQKKDLYLFFYTANRTKDWKFNNSLLKDNDFITQLKQNVPLIKQKYNALEDHKNKFTIHRSRSRLQALSLSCTLLIALLAFLTELPSAGMGSGYSVDGLRTGSGIPEKINQKSKMSLSLLLKILLREICLCFLIFMKFGIIIHALYIKIC
jgi:hypothetical protein